MHKSLLFVPTTCHINYVVFLSIPLYRATEYSSFIE